MDDVVLNKMESIERCVLQIRDYYDAATFDEDHMQQDAIVVNLQRAIKQCIDIATHIARVKRLGLPKESRDVFEFMKNNGLISEEAMKIMYSMVGFRNVAVHTYTELNMDVVKDIVRDRLKDFSTFLSEIADIDLP